MMNQLRPDSTVKAIIVILFSSILFRCVSATNHTVGGATGWDLESDVKTWASNTVFFTGDKLVFVYTFEHDVIEVGERGYVQCQIRSPIRTHNDGNTVIPLMNPGTRYFVCGKPGHCFQGMKVQVDVLPRPVNVSSSPSTAPIGSIGQVEGPGVESSRSPPRPSGPPGHSPPPTPSHDSPPTTEIPDIPIAPIPPSTNGASMERGVIGFKVGYVVYYCYSLLLIKAIANYFSLL